MGAIKEEKVWIVQSAWWQGISSRHNHNQIDENTRTNQKKTISITSANRRRKGVEPALWQDGGVLPYSNVTSVHNQIHKIIQDHTGQTVKMGKINVQFSKHSCGNISLNLPHYLITLSDCRLQLE